MSLFLSLGYGLRGVTFCRGGGGRGLGQWHGGKMASLAVYGCSLRTRSSRSQRVGQVYRTVLPRKTYYIVEFLYPCIAAPGGRESRVRVCHSLTR